MWNSENCLASRVVGCKTRFYLFISLSFDHNDDILKTDLAALTALVLPSSSIGWQLIRLTSFLCMGRDSCWLLDGRRSTESFSMKSMDSWYNSFSPSSLIWMLAVNWATLAVVAAESESINNTRAVFTGSSAKGIVMEHWNVENDFIDFFSLPGFFYVTPGTEKTKTQGKNSSQKLKEKIQLLGGFSL